MLHGSAMQGTFQRASSGAELFGGLERGIHQSTFEALPPISPRPGNESGLRQAPHRLTGSRAMLHRHMAPALFYEALCPVSPFV
jgi:hypothetical protein